VGEFVITHSPDAGIPRAKVCWKGGKHRPNSIPQGVRKPDSCRI
jgi:hypothetical protein